MAKLLKIFTNLTLKILPNSYEILWQRAISPFPLQSKDLNRASILHWYIVCYHNMLPTYIFRCIYKCVIIVCLSNLLGFFWKRDQLRSGAVRERNGKRVQLWKVWEIEKNCENTKETEIVIIKRKIIIKWK